jgi:branched-subunit amino acid aminotransferase/4-amino-4-deoxychorismate lyase
VSPPAPPLRLYAVEPDGARALAPRADARDLHELFDGLPLGIYEALRTFEHRKFLRLGEHFERAEASLRQMGWDFALDRARLCRALDRSAREWPLEDARVRFDVLAAPATVLGTKSRLLLALSPLPDLPGDALELGVAVDVAPRSLQRERPRVKEARWVVERRRASHAAGRTAAAGARGTPGGQQAAPGSVPYEHLLLDSAGLVLECTSANVFFVLEGEVVTAVEGVLLGVTRKLVLELLRELGLPTRFEPLALARLGACTESFLTSASRGPVPITTVVGARVGSGLPGPVLRALRAAYDDHVRRQAAPAV